MIATKTTDSIVDIVNENDKIIGQIPENDAYNNKDIITRGVSVFVYNSKGELLLQKRSEKKWRFPLHWTISVSGFVAHDEEPVLTALRELKEELNIKANKEDVTFLFKEYVSADIKHIIYVYKIIINTLGEIKNEEVASVRFFSINQIQKMIMNKEKLSPFFLAIFKIVHQSE